MMEFLSPVHFPLKTSPLFSLRLSTVLILRWHFHNHLFFITLFYFFFFISLCFYFILFYFCFGH